MPNISGGCWHEKSGRRKSHFRALEHAKSAHYIVHPNEHSENDEPPLLFVDFHQGLLITRCHKDET